MHHYGNGTGYGFDDLGDVAVIAIPFVVAAVVTPLVLRWRTRRLFKVAPPNRPGAAPSGTPFPPSGLGQSGSVIVLPAQGTAPDLIAELERLGALRDSETISPAEFQERKRQLFDHG
ncbi:hypothetical protein B7R54_09125 [Subtercola boreus]|uniref:SHOCT domain-containing protein n=1 Tax=Subtercola boreus TaxID=120213 RepID=A0A3E0VKI4_9MICO|nr:SHOCT domain-containing protein [Subtercola boreus]RFA09377.1 hypothetical protein B7R54_09125 [Subtercola boreus]TQL53587.1 putative oligomerization/nucleic acid binding protein [Subtercola boreus]